MTNNDTFQGDVFIHEYIKHTGDDNNLFGFSGTDAFKIATAGTDRLTVNSSGAVAISGTLTAGAFSADNVDSGTFADARIPNLAASKITSGTFADARIPNLAASKITSGTFADARIPSLSTSKITSGTLSTSRGGTGTTSVTGSGAMVKQSNPHLSGNIYFDTKIGIGSQNFYIPLHIALQTGGLNTGYRTYFSYYDPYNGGVLGGQTGYGWTAFSVYAIGAFITQSYFFSAQGNITSSDERIKKDIVDINDSTALDLIRTLKPKKYKYKDELMRGNQTVWGFIAQEVNDVFPEGVKMTTEYIPNIYELASVNTSNVLTLAKFDTSNLESNATVLRVIDNKDIEHLINIDEIIDTHNIRVKEDLTEWTGCLDETTGKVVAGNKLFVYGQQVSDFLRLKKDSIWTIATAALQEVDRQLQADKLRITEIDKQFTSVHTRLDTLENA
jgi:hypothetical protein